MLVDMEDNIFQGHVAIFTHIQDIDDWFDHEMIGVHTQTFSQTPAAKESDAEWKTITFGYRHGTTWV